MASGSQIQLGSLDYEEIREELKQFLSSQEELKDYNFEGSIISTIIDLLAYNTMYYAFYSNMQANESFLDSAQRTESLISLAKPLGYVVPHRRSGSVQITLSGAETAQNYDIPRYGLKLVGSDSSGTTRSFYNINPIVLSTDTIPTATELFYEVKELVLDANVNIDVDKQKFTIFDTTVDPTGIVVKVNGVEWRKQDGVDPDLNEFSQVYFVETSREGYVIRFGGLSETASGQIIGQAVGSNDIVTVSYFSSNGSLGNNIGGLFTSGDPNVQTAEALSSFSSGGFNSPDPDAIRFYAPRFFATQNRAVTSDDYITIGSSIVGVQPSTFNAYGADTLNNLQHIVGHIHQTPPGWQVQSQTQPVIDIYDPDGGSPGTVYLSFDVNGETPTPEQQSSLINEISKKSVSGISVAFVPHRKAGLSVKIPNPTEQEIQLFNSLFPDGHTTVDESVFIANGGRAFTKATIKYDFSWSQDIQTGPFTQQFFVLKNILKPPASDLMTTIGQMDNLKMISWPPFQNYTVDPETGDGLPKNEEGSASVPEGSVWVATGENASGLLEFNLQDVGVLSTVQSDSISTKFVGNLWQVISGNWVRVNADSFNGVIWGIDYSWGGGCHNGSNFSPNQNFTWMDGTDRFEVEVDVDLDQQGRRIYAPHNFYLTTRLEAL